MPRKKSDKIITHRIEFSPKERELIDTIIKTQKENQRLDAVTNTLQAVGVGLSGGGLLVAGLAAAAWFGYSFKDEVSNKTKDFVDAGTNIIAPILTGKTVEQMAQNVIDEAAVDVYALRERGQELVAQKNRFCNPTSQYYDETECARVTAELTALNKELNKAHSDMIADLKQNGMDDVKKEVASSLIWGIITLPIRY